MAGQEVMDETGCLWLCIVQQSVDGALLDKHGLRHPILGRGTVFRDLLCELIVF